MMVSPAANQRWLFRRDSYRPSAELIDTRRYEVAAIADDATAKAFVLTHHYEHSYPAARFRFGLYRSGELQGVAVFSHPVNDRVLTNVFPGIDPLEAVELGRFVLLDSVPGNGETWMLGRCFELLRREQLAGVVSFSDPCPRTNGDGAMVFPGHIGTIYQAHNGRYLGRGTARLLRLLPDGTVLNERTIAKARAGRTEKGWRCAVRLLVQHGAAWPLDDEDLAAWLRCWLPRLTRTVRHPGNHKYAWPLVRSARRILARGLGYPKAIERQVA